MEAGVASSLLHDLVGRNIIKLGWESRRWLTHAFPWLTFSLRAP